MILVMIIGLNISNVYPVIYALEAGIEGTDTEETVKEETEERDGTMVQIIDVNYATVIEGEEYELQITVENNDSYKYVNAYFTLNYGNSPIRSISSDSVNYVKSFIKGKEFVLTYPIRVEGGNAGLHTVTLNVTGRVPGIKDVNLDKEISIRVEESSSNVEFYGLESTKSKLSTGEKIEKILEIYADNFNQINQVELKITSLSEGIAIVSKPVVQDLTFIDGKEDVPIELLVADNLESGIYNLNFIATYTEKGKENIEFEKSFSVALHVNNGDEETVGSMTLTQISVSESNLNVNEKSQIHAVIKNVSSVVIDEISVVLKYSEAVVPITQDTIIIHNLLPNEEREIEYTVMATDEAESRNYSLGISASNEDYVVTSYTGVYVYNPDDEDDEDDTESAPKIMVDQYSISQEKLYAGDQFTLNITVMNTNSERSIKNVKISLNESNDSATKVLLPIGTSGSKFIDYLAPKESKDISLEYSILDQAEGNIYSLNINYNYEDVDNNGFEDQEIISIPVYQKQNLEVSDVRFGNILENGFTIETDFYNTGKIDIDNLMVDIELDELTTTNSNYYVGTFEAGRTDIYDVEITGSVPNQITGKIIFTYDDTFGKTTEYIKEFTLNNDTMQRMEGGIGGIENFRGEMPATGGSNSSITQYAFLGGAALILVLGISVFFVKKLKNRKVE